MTDNAANHHTFAILFLLLFIDGLSMGIIYPLITPILISPVDGILAIDTTHQAKTLFYAITISTFSFFTILGAPILGDLSDKIGRRRTLIIAMLGSFAAYAVAIFAIIGKSLLLLISSRAIAGLTFGSQPVAQAVVVDISSPQRKTANLGLVLLAVCSGVTLGPVVGSSFADNHLVSWFNNKTPLYVAGILSLTSATLLWLFFRESSRHSSTHNIKIFRGIQLLISAFKDKQIRWLSLCFLLMQLSWGCYVLFTPYFLTQEYNFSATQVSIFCLLMGLGLSLGFATLTGKLVEKFSLQVLTAAGVTIIGGSVLLTGVVTHPISVWLMVIPASMADALAYTTFITLFSNAVDAERQGWIMGVSTAIWGASWGTIALVSGFLAERKLALPLQTGAIFAFVSAFLILRYREKPSPAAREKVARSAG